MNGFAISLVILATLLHRDADDSTPLSAAELVRLGIRAMAEGHAEEAADRFAAGAAAAGGDHAIAGIAVFNEACARLEFGAIDRAEPLFERADGLATDPALSGAARFNLGKARFDRARAAEAEDVAGALAQLRSAAAAFGAAVRADRADHEAASALEITRRHIKRLQDRLDEERRQQEQQQQQSQESSDKLNDLAERQEDLADQSAKALEQQASDPQGAKEESDRLKQEQESLREEVSKVLEEIGDNPSSEESQEAARQIKEAMDSQKAAAKELSQSRPGRARPEQDNAARALRAASEAMARQAAQNGRPEEGDQQGSEQAQEAQAQGQPKDDQDPAVSALLDKERREREARERRRQQTSGGITPVERDW